MLQRLIHISRPRFWLYTAGTYLLGVSLGATNITTLLDPTIIVHFFFFLIPANILMYGINDIFDTDTDQFNEKKESKESKHTHSDLKILVPALIISGIYALLLMFLNTGYAQSYLIAFIILSVGYSTPPIRLKARPFLDSLSNVFYIFPGIIGYLQLGHSTPTLTTLAPLGAWAVAMHLYSAIPDITADTQAGLMTTARLLKRIPSLLVCSLLWGYFAWFVTLHIGSLGFITLIYATIPLMNILYKKTPEKVTYWVFPWINAFLGGAGFFLFIL